MKHDTLEQLSKKNKVYKILIVIFGVLTLFSGSTLLWHILSRDHYKPLGSFPLLDPAREFLPQDSYITNIQPLRDYLKELGDKYPDTISIYYEQLNSGANVAIHPDLHLFPASLSKLVQAILITKKVQDKVWTWDTELAPLPTDISSDSGNLYKTIGDKLMRVEDLLRELLVNSDNTAQNIFRHYLDVPDYLAFQDETGLQNLYNEKGFISAKEYTRVLRVLYTSSFLRSKYSEKILEYLSQATFKDYLSQGIPGDIKFAHKYGENREFVIFADSGIVYVPGKPYMLTVMIKGKEANQSTRDFAIKLMKEISEHAYAVSK